MWFDVQAALAEIGCEPRATTATTATPGAEPPSRVAHVAHVARPPASKCEDAAGRNDGPEGCPRTLEALTADERDQYEERAAILEYDGGFPRPEAERRAHLELVWSRSREGRENKRLTRLWRRK